MDIVRSNFILISDKRNNLKYLATGKLLYNAASLGIVHDTSTNTQKFFDKHRDDCISMAIHPDGVTVATGELHARPGIYIWNSANMKLEAIAKQGLTKGVDNLAFSTDGNLLLATTMDKMKKVVIFERTDNFTFDMITVDEASEQPFFGISWVNQSDFVGIGNGFYKYWSLGEEDMSCTDGVFPEGYSNILLCLAVLPNNLIACGSVTGELQKWSCTQGRHTPILKHQVNEGPLETIAVTSY